MGAGGPATHSVASVVATLEVEGSELLRPLPLVRRWRTKQNLDYCFLMMYAQSKGIYYVQVSTDALLWLPFPLPGPGWRALPSLCPSLVLAPFYLATTVQLEDDIIAKPNYLRTMKNFALQQPSEDWMILEFSQLGFIGVPAPSLPNWPDQTISLQPTSASVISSQPPALFPSPGQALSLFLECPL